MNIPVGFRFLTSLFGFIALTACGTSEKTAMVTLTTGLEGASQPINLMDHMRSLKFVGPISCVQNQVFAGYGLHQDGGPNQNATFPVGLTTPLVTSVTAVEAYSNGVAGWLAASSLKTITLPAPIGVPLDFGILGSLVVSPIATLEGNCPLVPAAGVSPGTVASPTFSLIGHATATILGVTNVPIKLWATNSLPSVGQFPLVPTAGTICAMSGSGSGDYASQLCPNLNFNSVSLVCTASFPCPSPGFVQFEYFDAINGPQKVRQLYNINSLNSAAAAMIPDITPLTVTLLDSNRVEIQKVVYNRERNSTTSGISTPPAIPFFRDVVTGVLTGNFIRVIEGSGVTPPQSFSIRSVQQNGSSFDLSWDRSRFAATYTASSSTDAITYNSFGLPNTTEAHMVANPISPGIRYYLSVQARTGAFVTQSSSMTITPMNPSTVTSLTLSPGLTGSKQITVNFSPIPNNSGESYTLDYGRTDAMTANPTNIEGKINLNATATSQIVNNLTGGASYSFIVEGNNNDHGHNATGMSAPAIAP